MTSDDNNLLMEFFSAIKPDGTFDKTQGEAAVEKLVARLNTMSPEQAKQAGYAALNKISDIRVTFDTPPYDRDITKKEILSILGNRPEELLKLLPRNVQQLAQEKVTAGMTAHQQEIAETCSKPEELGKTLKTAQENIDETLSSMSHRSLAKGTGKIISWMVNWIPEVDVGDLDPTRDSINSTLKEKFGEDRRYPQLTQQGGKNLSIILDKAKIGLPDNVELPDAKSICNTIQPPLVAGNESAKKEKSR